MTKRLSSFIAAGAGVIALAVGGSGVALAKHGADDPPGHHRHHHGKHHHHGQHRHGADDGPNHT